MKKERTDELFAMRSSTERLKILFFFLLVLIDVRVLSRLDSAQFNFDVPCLGI